MNFEREALLLKLSEPLPLLDLFEQARGAGMPLTMEQYDLLQRSLWRGYGSRRWKDLKRVCMILWVKSPDDDRAIFERVFKEYRQAAEADIPDMPESSGLPIGQETKPEKLPEKLPEVPLRLMPERNKPSERQGPIGIKTPTQQGIAAGRDFTLKQLPISVRGVQASWRALQQVKRSSIADEIDIERTVEQISRLGFLEDVVLRSSLRQRSELVVLVDEADGMTPYLPALKPLFQAIAGGWVTPARIYRFTGYPLRFLYDWERSTQAESVDVILSRLHRSRTIVLVVSDAGAAIGAKNDDRVEGTSAFLARWGPCINQMLWVNPVPEERWTGTPAEEIQALLGGRMLALDALDESAVKRMMQTAGMPSGRWGRQS
jgi:uncharacterized protein